MSSPPQPPGRLEMKKNACPSRASVGQKSFEEEFTGAPTFTGSLHGSPAVSRVESQMSIPPSPPGRLDAMKKDFPCRDMNGQPSSVGPLNSGSGPVVSTRTASLQSPNPPASARAVKAATRINRTVLIRIVLLRFISCTSSLLLG